MSYEYDRYLAQHKSNVEAGFRWLQKNLPEITEVSGAEHNIVFAHDQSKTEPDEYGPYDIYFYGGNRSYAVVEDFRKAWLLHIHRNPHHWQHWVLINDDPEEGEIVLEMIHSGGEDEMGIKNDCRKNAEGYSDPTAYEALKNIEQEEDRFHKLLETIFTLCELSDFHIEERIVIKDKRTGRIWR